MSHHQRDRYPTGTANSDRNRQTGTQSGADRYSTGGMDHTQLDQYPTGTTNSDRYRQTGTQSGADRYSEGVDHTRLDRYPTGIGPVLPRCRTGTVLSEISVTGMQSALNSPRPVPSTGYSAESYSNFC